MRKILILGANSAIARATARRWAKDGHALYLIGRDPGKLAVTTKDLAVRSRAPVYSANADLLDTTCHDALIDAARQALGGLDTVLLAHGELGIQKDAEGSYRAAAALIAANFSSHVSLLTRLANDFEKDRKGSIAVITSVAGLRGRKSNYVYGSAKGALSIFVAGLRHRLAGAGVQVLDLRVGFVDTPMTAGLKKGPLFASPDRVAHGITRAVERGCHVAYLPWFWRWIMLVIRLIPERLFLRLDI